MSSQVPEDGTSSGEARSVAEVAMESALPDFIIKPSSKDGNRQTILKIRGLGAPLWGIATAWLSPRRSPGLPLSVSKTFEPSLLPGVQNRRYGNYPDDVREYGRVGAEASTRQDV